MVRRSQKLMTGWSFTMPDSNTRSVDLPHTWNGKMVRTAEMITCVISVFIKSIYKACL